MPHSYRRPMQRIDRKELYTNLEARIQYLHSFLDFSTNDIIALTTGAKYIKALIPAIVNIVYKKLLQYDITARAFETRSTSYEGPIDVCPAEDSPQIQHRKMFLRGYLNKLCSDPSRMEFWEYLDKVGMMHVGRGRTHPLHVEYVHISVTLSFIQDILTEAILSHPKLRLDRKIGLVKAVGKVIWIQNDLFAKWYVRDGEEFVDEVEEVAVEREGWLHGKKVLSDSGSESDIEDGPVGQCPFKGMAKDMLKMSVQESHAPSGVDLHTHADGRTKNSGQSTSVEIDGETEEPAVGSPISQHQRPLSQSGISKPVERPGTVDISA